jgi:hypothetical protein
MLSTVLGLNTPTPPVSLDWSPEYADNTRIHTFINLVVMKEKSNANLMRIF